MFFRLGNDNRDMATCICICQIMSNERMAASCITAITPLFDNSKNEKSQCILYAIYAAACNLCLFIWSHIKQQTQEWRSQEAEKPFLYENP